jgi:hypothetical protein
MRNRKFLLKYTNIASLFDTLLHKRIFLLDPRSWEDKNDSYYIDVFKKKRGLNTVLALCFAETNETFHHWKVFSGNVSGVCIEFDKEKLLEHFKGIKNVKICKVKYRKINELKDHRPKEFQLPFIKRHPYRDEKELRIIYSNKNEEIECKAFTIRLDCINKILLNHLLPDALCGSIRDVIQGIYGCKSLRINRTTLIDNEKWKAIAR